MALVGLALNLFSFVGNIDTASAILFIVGLVMLAAEIFMPGFGIVGGLGLVLLVIGIVLTAETVLEAVVMILILLAVTGVVLYIILRSAKKGKLSKKLILWSSAKKEEGFSAVEDHSVLVGRTGTALTMLRPAGTAEFDGHRMDVVTEGAFIAQGTRIRVIRTEGRRIVVQADV